MTPQSDEDEVWRRIVASFNEPAEHVSGAEPWPERENIREESPREADPGPPELPDPAPSAGPPSDEDDHYVPPPPPPLPKVDPGTKIAWAALFGGPAYLLLAAVLKWPMDGWIVFTAVAAFIGGFVALVVRMGDGPPPDSGWDDGAII